jgi:folate-binding protein YgfZ
MTDVSTRNESATAPAGYWDLQRGCGWVDPGPRTVLVTRGADAVRFIDAFTTTAVSRLAVGTGSEGFFTDARGWVLALVNVLRTDDGVWIDGPAGINALLRDHLEHHHIRERVEIVDESSRYDHLLVAGPRARDWLAARADVPPPERGLDHARARLGPVAVDIVRIDGGGPAGFLVRVDAADRGRLVAWLEAEGLPRADPRCFATSRIEAGMPWPVDIVEKTLPQELGRDERAICFTKGCYLGQETVARIDALGHVNRRFVAFVFDHEAPPGAVVRAGDDVVGRLTSVCRSPLAAAWLGLGLMQAKPLATATSITVDGIPARVTSVPLAVSAGGTPEHPQDLEETGEVLLETRRFRVVRVGEPCADGSRREREVIRHPGSVVVVPLLGGDMVCLVEVVRVAVGGTLLELPAGTLDREETLAAAAARELAEETGYRAGRVVAAGSFWMSPGILRERMHLFVADELVAGPQALEPGEQIRTRTVAWREAVAMCLDGRIEDAKTIAGILLVDTRRRAVLHSH